MHGISLPRARCIAALALLGTIALSGPALALGGGAGCADLPDYERAQGVMQGIPSACDMSVERARAIIAAHDGGAVAGSSVAPVSRHRNRRHHHDPSVR